MQPSMHARRKNFGDDAHGSQKKFSQGMPDLRAEFFQEEQLDPVR